MSKMDDSQLQRSKKGKEEEPEKERRVSVTAGAVDKIADFYVNATRDKMREVTVINAWQGMQFPILDMVNKGMAYIIEIATYRDDPDLYKKIYKQEFPESPDLIDEYLYRTAQWGRSVKGRGLDSVKDIVLAEIETNAEETETYGGKRGIEDD